MCMPAINCMEHKVYQGHQINLITCEELKEKLDSGETIQLVFTLSDWQYQAMHIPGSRHFRDLEETVKMLDPNDEIIVYCSNPPCFSSILAYHFLVDHGYKRVRRYAGGLLDWDNAGYPLEGDRVN